MPRSKKDGRGRVGEGRRITPGHLLPALLVLLLLIPVRTVGAAGQTVSGSTHLGNTLSQYGTTSYTVDYEYPSTVDVGSNLSISLTLNVDPGGLTGLIEYTTAYRFIVDVFVGATPLNGSIISANNATYLYPGSSWGPNNVTIPLTASDTGLAKGASANATVSVILEDNVYFGLPYAGYQTEPSMEGAAGSLTIQNPITTSTSPGSGQSSSQTYLPYALLASGVVLMLLAVALPRGPRPSQAVQK